MTLLSTEWGVAHHCKKKLTGWAVALSKKRHCVFGVGVGIQSAMSVVCTLSVCADFITVPEGENSNRPLLHLMPGPYIIRVYILMLWTGARERISVHFTTMGKDKLEFKSPCFSTFPTHQQTVSNADYSWIVSTQCTLFFVVSGSQPTPQTCKSNAALTSADRVTLSSHYYCHLSCVPRQVTLSLQAISHPELQLI